MSVINGISPKQTVNNYKSSEHAITRRVLRSSWNQSYATGVVNGYNRVITPFRAVNSLGDFLDRKNYVCGGSNQVNASKPGWKGHIGSIISQCDETGIEGYVGNTKYVSDSSDYIKYKKQRVSNTNYNDNTFGGDESNGSYTFLMAVRR
jgi:hypothetical protein